MHTRTLFVVFAAMTWSMPSSAASILYLSDARSLSTSYSRYYGDGFSDANGRSVAAPVFGASWSADWADPTFASTLSPTEITLDVSVRRTTTVRIYSPEEPQRIIYSSFEPQDLAIAQISFAVSDATESIWTRDGVARSVSLLPGVTYWIDERIAGGVDAGPAVVTRSLSVRLVPEPGTAALLALGLAAIARRRVSAPRD